jgi:phosphatidylglycerophosphatase C
MSLVFFDFDGTLTKRDTLLSLGLFLARTKPNRFRKTAYIVFMFGLLKSRVITNDRFKRGFCRVLLSGESGKELKTRCRRFTDEYVQHVINQSVLEILQKHRRQGDDVYLVSSNFSFVLQPLQKMWSTSGVLATEAEVEGGRFTGRLLGRSCDAQEKLDRVLQCFDRDSVREATAYGDSRGDRQLLAFVRNAVWV